MNLAFCANHHHTEDDLAQLSLSLQGLASDSQATLLAVDASYVDALHQSEASSLTSAVAKRRAQFASGRAAARLSAARLGYVDLTVPAGRDRAPIWPDSLVGTITHTNQWALAWLSRRQSCCGLGVDLENGTRLSDASWALVLSDSELVLVNSTAERQLAATVLFSIKESIYKAIYPTVARFVEFQEVELHYKPQQQRFEALLLGPLAEQLSGFDLSVGYRCYGQLIASWALLND